MEEAETAEPEYVEPIPEKKEVLQIKKSPKPPIKITKPTVASEMRDRSNGRGAHSREFVQKAEERFNEECTF
jgi:hypothetical protein